MVNVLEQGRCRGHPPPTTPHTPGSSRQDLGVAVTLFHVALISAETKRGFLTPDPNPKPTPAWLGGWVRWRHAITKKTCFLYVFLRACSQNTTNCNVIGFRPCLSKPSYRAPKWALMVRLMQKERLKSPQKSPILENQAIWVILAISAKTAILVIFCQPFPNQGGHAEKKVPLRALLASTRPSCIRI